MYVDKNYLVEKRNILNEVRSSNMKLEELRFFSIYLARINARDISTRIVRFSMEDFREFMEFGRINIGYLTKITNSMLCKVVNVPDEAGGHLSFQLFKECRIAKDANGEWFVEIDAHDQALPLMFEFKDKYFTYELWNALSLKSANQLRVYEILKQYEHVGERIISIAELKDLLGFSKTEYTRYSNFKTCVLDVCKAALESYTDIKFTYEPSGKLGRGGKIVNLRFIISHNESHVYRISFDDFLEIKRIQNNKADIDLFQNRRFAFLAEACDLEFIESEMQVLFDLLIKIIPYNPSVSVNQYDVELFNFLKSKYGELKWRSEKKDIKNRFAYLRKIIEEYAMD